MIKRYVYQSVERCWDIHGYPDYFFNGSGGFYRMTKRGDVVQLPRTVKRYTQGYVLKSKFFSLTKLRPLLRRHVPTDHPAGF